MKVVPPEELIRHIVEAAQDARRFTEGMSKQNFLADRRTQQAVVFSLVIVGEAATRLMDQYPEFVAERDFIPWRNMRGMRNRIAHGYFQIDMEVVWKTVQDSIPELLQGLGER